jgi:hypothetical protein
MLSFAKINVPRISVKRRKAQIKRAVAKQPEKNRGNHTKRYWLPRLSAFKKNRFQKNKK